jgi:hypothetical protein
MTCGAVAGMLAAQAAFPALAAPAYALSLTAAPVAFSGPCPALIKLEGKIVNTSGFVPSAQYSLLNSDGIDSFLMTATFDAAHTFLVHDARTPSASGVYWVQIRIHDGPRIVAESNRAEFNVKCTDKGSTPNPNATPTRKPTQPPNVTPSPKPTHPVDSTPSPKPTHPTDVTPSPNPSGHGVPCRQIATAVVRCPDLTARPPASVGGHATTWGAGVTLTFLDSIPHARPYCAFDIVYTMANIGTGNAGPVPLFKNVLRVDGGAPVSIQSSLSLVAGGTQTIHTQAYLPSGVHQLSLDIDDGNVIAESNEANNHFAMKYQLVDKRCKPRG